MKVDHWGNIKKGLSSIYVTWYLFIYFLLVLVSHYSGKHQVNDLLLICSWVFMIIDVIILYQYHVKKTITEFGERRQ